jgi:mercuric ion transport protein
MLRVELIYDSDCPNVQDARKALLSGFAKARVQPWWTEWDRGSPESPPYVRQYGSPTILLDGRDVAGSEPSSISDCCRIYVQRKIRGAPPVSSIAAALEKDSGYSLQPGGWRFLASLPSLAATVLPVGICPVCWPIYASILGSVGLGFLLGSRSLLPFTVALLAVALLSLALRAKVRRGYGPFSLGIASVSFVLVFKFAYVLNFLVYAGAIGLLIASLWNAWPKSRSNKNLSSVRSEELTNQCKWTAKEAI